MSCLESEDPLKWRVTLKVGRIYQFLYKFFKETSSSDIEFRQNLRGKFEMKIFKPKSSETSHIKNLKTIGLSSCRNGHKRRADVAVGNLNLLW